MYSVVHHIGHPMNACLRFFTWQFNKWLSNIEQPWSIVLQMKNYNLENFASVIRIYKSREMPKNLCTTLYKFIHVDVDYGLSPKICLIVRFNKLIAIHTFPLKSLIFYRVNWMDGAGCACEYFINIVTNYTVHLVCFCILKNRNVLIIEGSYNA